LSLHLPESHGFLKRKNKVSANRQFPILDWIFDYQKDWLRWDLIAGLITAAVVIPKAMAYATIAGLPVQVGLYTVLVPMAIYAVVGTSRPLSMSTTTTLAILAADAIN
jgi:sulfate permease, SulP family